MSSITDAATIIPTDLPLRLSDTHATEYTEQRIGTFTVGTLSSSTELITEVETRLQRGTLSTSTVPSTTQIGYWLERAKMELSEIRGFTFRRKYAQTTTEAGTYIYGLPPDYNGGYTSLRDVSNKRSIKLIGRHIFDSKYPDPSDESNNEPRIACIKKMSVWLIPPPDGAYTLEIEYDRSGAETTENDYSWLPEMERWRCVDFATAEAFKVLHQWSASREYEAKWNNGMRKAVRADGKRKWREMGFQAYSNFQEHAARNYQSLEDEV